MDCYPGVIPYSLCALDTVNISHTLYSSAGAYVGLPKNATYFSELTST